jgi:beta-barrel assembly-enhancing protease
MRRSAAALGLALAIGLGASCSSGLPIPGLGGGELGVDKEREITDEVSRQIRKGAPFVTDPVLLAYVNELGQELVRATEPQPFLYRFSIIQDDALNAFTIGGGYIYLNSGVIAQAGSVSELSGVLAHEIAHVRNRHIAKRAEGQGITTLATLAAAAAVAAGADPALMAVSESLNVALQLRNSREAESEADREGIAYMIRAGYQPEGMARFFERISAASPESGSRLVPSYLFTHPAIEERTRAARSLMGRMERPPGLRVDDARLAEMQDRLAMLLTPMAGGSGLQARTAFDPARTDAILARATAALEAKNYAEAEALLAEAAEIEPADPRVALARADVAEAREDLPGALRFLRRAFAIDPSVPLVQLRLGDVLRRLGNRGEAVFYLEQAAANLRAGSSLQKRAEKLLGDLPFPPLSASSLPGEYVAGVPVFAPGQPVRWDGEIGARYADRPVRARWIAPGGGLEREDALVPDRERRVSATLEQPALAPGDWTLAVMIGDVQADQLRFVVRGAPAAAP